jgi:YidC/Oxa1 family membrane protein insertase
MTDSKNFIVAIVLSIVVLFAWQYFFAGPQMERARQQATEQAATSETTPAPAAQPGAPPGAESAGGALATRDAALAASPRVPIDTPRVSGSINLRGARLDDLRLKDYHETVDRSSPTIVLLSPSSGPAGYFAETGWIPAAAEVAVPASDAVWTAPENAALTIGRPVTLTWDNGAGLVFTRTVAIDEEYMFTVTDGVENRSGAPVSLTPYGRVVRLGEVHSSGFYILHEGPIGVFGDEGLEEISYSSVRDDRELAMPESNTGWLGITDKYWAVTLVPEQGKPFTGRFAFFDNGAPRFQSDYRTAPLTIAPGGKAETAARVFAGAKQVSVVDGYDAQGIDRFELLIDWGWFYFITKPMFFFIDWFYRLLGNFGLAILAVTVVVKLVFFPLANRSYRSMSAMKKLQPQMTEIRERFADDRAKQQQALMEMYKREKINPIAGCWPMLLQIPVFFALYKVLFVTIEMRHAPFFGWIQDLSAPDPLSVFTLFGLIPWDPAAVPVIGHFLLIGIWPLIMGVTMWVQMRLNPTPPDPTQAIIFNWMPVIFTFMLAGFPAGLVIYWAWNNTLSILQQAIIMRRQGVKIELWDNVLSVFRRKPKKSEAEPAPETKTGAKADAKS